LSIEQVFRNIQWISALDRDSHAARVFCFDVLDTFTGMGLLDFMSMCTLSKARDFVLEIEAEMPAEAAHILLPRARSAVQALEDLQNGFFGVSCISDDGRITLPDNKHGSREYSKEDAIAIWLRVLRNAGHGFGGRPGSPR
jgi:hypothetical protein